MRPRFPDRQFIRRTICSCGRWFCSNWLLISLLAVSVTRLWLMPLPSSFWTDEMETAFIVQHPDDPSLAAMPQVTASIYFALPRAVRLLFGFPEILYRLPSVLFMGIALFIIGRLAARLIDPRAAWFSVFACLALPDFNYYAAEARPYALGICVAAASLHFLIEWLDTARWKSALLFAAFAALLWRVHLVYGAFYPVFFGYTILRLVRFTTRVGWISALLLYSMLALTLIPVARDALKILPNGRSHVFASIPDTWSLAEGLSWELVVPCAGLALLAGRYLKSRRRAASLDARMLIVAWWLWMPVCFFSFSRITGIVLFQPRYFSLALPGAALAATAAAALYLPGERWRQAAAVLAVFGLIVAGQWSILWPDHTPEDWRQASLDADLAAQEPDTPVIAVSPYFEALPPMWSPEYHLPGLLYAPLFVYPVRGRVYPFPFLRSQVAEKYAVGLLRDTLLKRPRFIVYGVGRIAASWARWFATRPELSGWRYIGGGERLVRVDVFENPTTAGPR
jgi:hypothetical protein